MELSLCDLRLVADKGESVDVELREVCGDSASIADTLVSLANTRGGTLYIGVADSKPTQGEARRETPGFPANDWDRVQDIVNTAARSDIIPPLHTVVRRVDVSPGNAVMAVGVPQSAHVHSTKSYQYLVRTPAGKRVAEQWELAELFAKRGAIGAGGLARKDVDGAAMQKLLSPFASCDCEQGAEPEVCLSPVVDRNLMVAYARLDGDDLGSPLTDNWVMTGPMLTLIEPLLDRVRGLMPVVMPGPEGHEQRLLPYEAVHEVLMNAIAHCDYNVPGNIRLLCFTSAFVVMFPGGLPSGYTVADVRLLRAKRIVHRMGLPPIVIEEKARNLAVTFHWPATPVMP
eukprot:m51a1_g13554 hypothetical protein (343) ;mRNA; r:548-1931